MTTHRHTVTLEGQGYQVTGCFGAGGCPHRALDAPDLPRDIAAALKNLEIGRRLVDRLGHPLRAHNVVKIAVSYCPNACARSQIADVGCIGAARPAVEPERCTACGACAAACREGAVRLDGSGAVAGIDAARCVGCGACATACPEQAITVARRGFRLMLGGKLGRHPRFAEELPGLYAPADLPGVVAGAVGAYLGLLQGHERLGDVVARLGAAALVREGRA